MLPGMRDIITTLLARGVAMAGPFGVSIITARVLGPEDRGQYFLIYSYAQIAAQIANFGLHSSNTYLGARNPHRVGPLLVNSLYVATFVAPAVALLVVLVFGRPDLLHLPFGNGDPVGPAAFTAVFLAPLLVAYLYITNMAVAIARINLFNILTIFGGLAIVVAASAAGIAGGGTVAFLLAVAGGFATACVLGSIYLLRGRVVRLSFDVGMFRDGVAFALRAYFATLFGFLLLRVAVLALQQEASLEEVGQFSIAMQIMDALVTIPGMVGLLVFPALVRSEKADRWNALWGVFLRLGALMFALLALLALLIPFAMVPIFGEAYRPAIGITIALFPATFIISLISILSQYLAAEGFPWRQVAAWVVGFAAQAIMSFAFAEKYGALGIAAGLTISTLLVFAVLLAEVLATHARSKSE